MKKLFFLCLSLSLFTAHAAAEQAGVHRFGCFNVRYVSPSNGDTGDKLWVNRKSKVIKIVTDYDFDIIGMNEVTGNNTDAAGNKNVNQKKDIETGLTDYTTIAYEREDKQYSWNTVSYKTAKYDCLDHMAFWLSPTPDKVSYGWDCGTEGNIYRRCIVAHMRVKATGEEFYFCCVHCNFGAYSSGYNGARVVADQVRQRCGNKPVVVVGDYNLNRSSQPIAYRGYAYYFNEAKLLADESDCLPTTNPKVNFTTNNWTRPGLSGCSGAEYDHLFYNKMKCLSYYVITETYGSDVTPSDHFPVLGRFILEPNHPTRYFAANEQELKTAMDKAYPMDTIQLKEGSFSLSEPIVFQKSLCLMGGYTSLDQYASEGITTIQCASMGTTLFDLSEWYSLQMENICVQNQSTAATSGGSVVACQGSLLTLRNCRFENNASSTMAGVIAASADRVNVEQCQFVGNTASTMGGAMRIAANSAVRIMDNVFQNNSATTGSAVALISCETANIQNNSFIGNSSTKMGTFYCAAYDKTISLNFLNCAFLNNTLTASSGLATAVKLYGGSGINVNMSSNKQNINIGHCSFFGNKTTFGGTSNFTGAAVNIFKGHACIMNNIVLGNTTTMKDATPTYEDITVAADADCWSKLLNVQTADIADFASAVTTAFGGAMDNKLYTAQVTEQHTYPIYKTMVGNYEIKCATNTKRLCESAFSFDLNEDGVISGYVTSDMLHNTKPLTACIGAVEYIQGSDLQSAITTPTHAAYIKKMVNGQLVIEKAGQCYSILGSSIY